MNVTFYLKQSGVTDNYVIMVQVMRHLKKIAFTTGAMIKKEHWSTVKQRVVINRTTVEFGLDAINGFLDKIHSEVSFLWQQELKKENPDITNIKPVLKNTFHARYFDLDKQNKFAAYRRSTFAKEIEPIKNISTHR